MNFKKLSKEKRNNLILVVIATLAIMGGLGFGLIKYQYGNLQRLAEKKVTTQAKLDKMRSAVKNASRLEAEVAASKQTLADMESDIANGDLYSWIINTLRSFKAPYKVDMPQFGQITPETDMTLLPNFPYKQTSLTVAGKAHFHDFGKFIADFENKFPHIRVVNLSLDVDSTPGDPEMLGFKMDVVTLVKGPS